MENANDYRLIDALISSQNAVSALNIQLTKLEKEKIDLTRLISLVIANTRLNYDRAYYHKRRRYPYLYKALISDGLRDPV